MYGLCTVYLKGEIIIANPLSNVSLLKLWGLINHKVQPCIITTTLAKRMG